MSKKKAKNLTQGKQKKKVWRSKQVLASPFAPVMPAAALGTRDAVLRILLSAVPVPFAQREPRPSRASLPPQAAPAEAAPPPHKSCKKPARLLVGINEVTRALERGGVALVLLARDVTPALLVQHVPVLCFLAGAQLVVMPGDGTDMGVVLGTRRVLAVGVAERREDGDSGGVAEMILQGLKPLATRLEYPWLAAAKRKKGTPPPLPEPVSVPHRNKKDIG